MVCERAASLTATLANACTTVRVPVIYGHSEAVTAELEQEVAFGSIGVLAEAGGFGTGECG